MAEGGSLDRRSLLKKTAVAGSLVWAVPAITRIAPAMATASDTDPPDPPGVAPIVITGVQQTTPAVLNTVRETVTISGTAEPSSSIALRRHSTSTNVCTAGTSVGTTAAGLDGSWTAVVPAGFAGDTVYFAGHYIGDPSSCSVPFEHTSS
jgi:hypothetical protein